jgi:hypothetical protein
MASWCIGTTGQVTSEWTENRIANATCQEFSHGGPSKSRKSRLGDLARAHCEGVASFLQRLASTNTVTARITYYHETRNRTVHRPT